MYMQFRSMMRQSVRAFHLALLVYLPIFIGGLYSIHHACFCQRTLVVYILHFIV